MKTATATTLPAGLVIKTITPTVREVRYNDKVVGKLGKGNNGFRFFGDPESKWVKTPEEAALALCAHAKVDFGKQSDDKKKSKKNQEDATPKADPKAEFEGRVDKWFESNHTDRAAEWAPEFKRVLLSLRTRKKFLKDIKDLELAQAMLDFEVSTLNRSRQVKHLRSKVSGLARRGGGDKKLTPAQIVGDLLNTGDLIGYEVAPDGEQPKQLTLRVTDENGVEYRVLLTVRDIECTTPEEDEGDDDEIDSDDDADGSDEGSDEVAGE